jgi:hypothetical protein
MLYGISAFGAKRQTMRKQQTCRSKESKTWMPMRSQIGELMDTLALEASLRRSRPR